MNVSGRMIARAKCVLDGVVRLWLQCSLVWQPNRLLPALLINHALCAPLDPWRSVLDRKCQDNLQPLASLVEIFHKTQGTCLDCVMRVHASSSRYALGECLMCRPMHLFAPLRVLRFCLQRQLCLGSCLHLHSERAPAQVAGQQ